jgi:hypothetical protein
VVTVESPSELHRPRWEDHPTSPHLRQLHLGLDGHGGRDVHLVFSVEAIAAHYDMLEAIIHEGP